MYTQVKLHAKPAYEKKRALQLANKVPKPKVDEDAALEALRQKDRERKRASRLEAGASSVVLSEEAEERVEKLLDELAPHLRLVAAKFGANYPIFNILMDGVKSMHVLPTSMRWSDVTINAPAEVLSRWGISPTSKTLKAVRKVIPLLFSLLLTALLTLVSSHCNAFFGHGNCRDESSLKLRLSRLKKLRFLLMRT